MSTERTEAAVAAPSGGTDSVLLKATLLTAGSLTVMSGATIAPALPAMQAYFSAVPNAPLLVRLVLTMPALFIVLGAPAAGIVADRLGRKPLLVASAILYGLAGGSGFVLTTLPGILAGRALLGLAVAGVMTSTTTLLADYYEGPVRARLMGALAATMGFGGVVFLIAGGLLADLHWRMPFLIYLAAFLLLPFLVGVLFEPERDSAAEAAQRAARPPWPLRELTLIYGLVLLTMLVFYLVPVQLPFYLKRLSGAGAAQSGFAIAAANLFSASASLLYGRLSLRLSYKRLVMLALGLSGIGYLVIGVAGGYGVVLAGLAVTGAGLGLMMPNLNIWLAAITPTILRGRALGGLTTFVFLGQFLSPLASQPAVDALGFSATFAAAGGLLLLVVLLLLRGRRGPATPSGARSGG